jgi:hypothetical protein
MKPEWLPMIPPVSEVSTMPVQAIVTLSAPGTTDTSVVWLQCWSSYSASSFAPA